MTQTVSKSVGDKNVVEQFIIGRKEEAKVEASKFVEQHVHYQDR